MEYLLLIYGDEKARAGAPAGATEQMYAAYGAYTKALLDAGVMRGGNELKPTSAATTVRLADGRPQVLDGPYAETKEQLGGYYVIDVPDLDAAIAWAARCPGAGHGTMEVRPIVAHG